MRLVDLDGDGIDDVLMVTPTAYVYYPSRGRGKEGFGPPRTVPRQSDELRGPGVPFFATSAAAVFLADMTGDGLADLVRVEPGRVVYWPAQGHGRFGPMVVMGGALQLERGGRIDPARVKLADLDGTGTADLLYFAPDGLRIHFNRCGNSFDQPLRIDDFPTADAWSTLSLADVRGNGTTCIAWVTTRRESGLAAAVRFVDVVGAMKPYLLTQARNNLGLETTVQYTPSTAFYLADRAAGRPWATRLPFPVQVVSRTETRDAIAETRHTRRFAYHHGAYDPREREMRGFGMVETWDADVFSAAAGAREGSDAPPPGAELERAPVRTRTWFHTGIWRPEAPIEVAYAAEYWSPDAPAADPRALPNASLPELLSPAEVHEATRALRGAMLRQEVYADDGTPLAALPYSVTHGRQRVERVQPEPSPQSESESAGVGHAVFRTHAMESVTTHYERSTLDPRVMHRLVVEVDAFGVPRRSVAVAYGRSGGEPEQQRTWATLEEHDVLHLDGQPSGYRLAIPVASRRFELHGVSLASSTPWPFEAVRAAAQSAAPIAYDQMPSGSVEKRVLGHVLHRYYDASAIPAALPLGTADVRAVPYESYALALTGRAVGARLPRWHAG